jgi:Alternative complex III, ActD subunit
VAEPAQSQVLGVFAEVDAAVEAIETLRSRGMKDLTVFTPLPQHDLEHALHPPQSPVRLFTLVGGMTGTATGFALATWTSLDWPLVTGGKPIISLPPFVVIGFELTILFGALSTVLGLLVAARLPRRKAKLIYDPSFSAGDFGLLVQAPEARTAEVREVLQQSGAQEVRVPSGEVGLAQG